jgi:hypothetical protein
MQEIANECKILFGKSKENRRLGRARRRRDEWNVAIWWMAVVNTAKNLLIKIRRIFD